MKKLILPLLVAGAFAAPSMAQAASTPYVSLSTGLNLANNSTVDGVSNWMTYKTGYLVNGAVGLKMDNVRVEAEIGYHHNAIDKVFVIAPTTNASASLWTFMANAYYDFDMKGSSVSPYVMGGLGLSRANVKIPDLATDDSSSQFAWQLGAGIGIKASNEVTIDLGYRYLKPSEGDFSGTKVTLGGSGILAGIRVDL
ncbi:MAG: porin family protein [Chlorobaculum sp.]|nr:porin family protein [Chlorobaculum sp.]